MRIMQCRSLEDFGELGKEARFGIANISSFHRLINVEDL